jgi:K+-sensing histidine kinase KdpD
VLEEINKPVLAIPEKAKFDKKFDNIAFLVDYEEDERGPLLEIIRQAQEFNAQLTVIHFDLAHGDSISPRMENLKKSISAEHLPHVEFISIDSIDIKTSVQNFCIEKKIDMLCLINHRRNFYQRLFSYSLTQELLNGLDIPLMAIYRD